MPTHALNLSAVSNGGSESSFTSLSSSNSQRPPAPAPATERAHARNPSVVSKAGSDSTLTSLPSSDSQLLSQPHTPPPPAEPTHARNSSVVSKSGSLSSLSSLSSDDSEPAQQSQVPRPRTPQGGNVPALTHSPSSSDASSPESIRRYGLSTLSSQYQGVGEAIEALLASESPNHDFEHLYAIAQKHLKVFDDPAYSHLDKPEWVKRVTRHTADQPVFKFFTVRNLIKSMFHVAKDLKLERSQKYVAAAICSCGVGASTAGSSSEQKEKLARDIQLLASTWAGFLLWPFYAQQDNKAVIAIDDVSESATPTMSDTASLLDKGLKKSRTSTLQESVLLRDGYKCVLTGFLDSSYWQDNASAASRLSTFIEAVMSEDGSEQTPELAQVEVAHIFRRSNAVYDATSRNEADVAKFRAATITFELLRHYCQLHPKYINNAELIDHPKNAITLSDFFHSRFDAYSWCLKPTETEHCYEVVDYHKQLNHMKKNDVGRTITLRDHSVERQNDAPKPGASNQSGTRKRPHEAMGIDLPDPELLRLHAALTGVLRLSGAAEVFDDIRRRRGPGNPPVPSADGEAFFKTVVDVDAEPTILGLDDAASRLQVLSL